MPTIGNPRHEKFSQLVASGTKPVEAYVSLGYSAAGAAQAASKLLKREHVRQRIDEILSDAAQSTAAAICFDHTRVLNRLDELSRKAEELGQISAAVRCEELIGKARGMFVDRSDHFVWDGDLSKLTDDQLDELVAVMERRAFGGNRKALEAAKRQFMLMSGFRVIDLTPDQAQLSSAESTEAAPIRNEQAPLGQEKE